jgi:hypothetical protein
MNLIYFHVSILTKQNLFTHYAVSAVLEVIFRQAEVPVLRPGYGSLLCQYHDRPTQYLKQ